MAHPSDGERNIPKWQYRVPPRLIKVMGHDVTVPIIHTSGQGTYEAMQWDDGITNTFRPVVPSMASKQATWAQYSDGRFINPPKYLATIDDVTLYYRMSPTDGTAMFYTFDTSTRQYIHIMTKSNNMQYANQFVAPEFGDQPLTVADLGFQFAIVPEVPGTVGTEYTFNNLVVSFFFSQYNQLRGYGGSVHDSKFYKQGNLAVYSAYCYQEYRLADYVRDRYNVYGYVWDGDFRDSFIGSRLVAHGDLPGDADSFADWYDEITEDDEGDEKTIDDDVIDDFSGDDIGFPESPEYGAANMGLYKIYKATPESITEFSQYLFSPSIVEAVIKSIVNPMDYVISLAYFPFNVPDGRPQNLKFLWNDTGIIMERLGADANYIDVSGGTWTYYGATKTFLDYSTSVQLYIPFVGTVSLDPQIVVNSEMELRYKVDILTGDCMAYLLVNKRGFCPSGDGNNSIIYRYRGNMAMQFPLNSRDFGQSIKAITGAVMGAVAGDYLGSAIGLMSAAPKVSTNDYTTNASFVDTFEPYLIISEPMYARASNYSHYNGYVVKDTYKLGNLSGYVKIQQNSLDSDKLTCTEEEKDMIQRLLEEGVYI